MSSSSRPSSSIRRAPWPPTTVGAFQSACTHQLCSTTSHSDGIGTIFRPLKLPEPPELTLVARRWQLLRDAVNVSTPEQNVPARHADHAPAGGKAPELHRCRAVSACIEERHYDAAIRDIKVDVACRQAFARLAQLGARAVQQALGFLRSHQQRPWHGQLVHFESPATRIARLVQTFPGVERNGVLRIAALIGPGEGDLAGAQEAREIIDVATRLIAEYALAEPDDGADAKVR